MQRARGKLLIQQWNFSHRCVVQNRGRGCGARVIVVVLFRCVASVNGLDDGAGCEFGLLSLSCSCWEEHKSRQNKRVYIPNRRVLSAPLTVRQRGGQPKGWKRCGLLILASSREVATRWDRKCNSFLMCNGAQDRTHALRRKDAPPRHHAFLRCILRAFVARKRSCGSDGLGRPGCNVASMMPLWRC